MQSDHFDLNDSTPIAGQVEDALKAVEGTFGNASQSPLGTFNGDLERADRGASCPVSIRATVD